MEGITSFLKTATLNFFTIVQYFATVVSNILMLEMLKLKGGFSK